jgi:hypothetical protein
MTPSDRLARSRLAIVEHLSRRENKRDGRAQERAQDEAQEDAAHAEADQQQHWRGAGWFSGMSGAARSWWRHHPIQLGVEMATPMLQSYMRRKPFTVLGVSAAVGVALVVTRPWRVISVTTLLIAIVKSSQLSGVVMSALSGAHDWQPQPPPPRQPQPGAGRQG